MTAAALVGQLPGSAPAAVFGEADLSTLFPAISGAWPVLLLGVAAPYLALRVRDAAADRPDPDLGAKVVYHAVFSGGLLLALSGLAALAAYTVQFNNGGVQLVRPTSENIREQGIKCPPVQDISFHLDYFAGYDPWANILTGVPCLVVSGGLIRWATNTREFPAVRRMFVGGRLAIIALVVYTDGLKLNRALLDNIRYGPPGFTEAAGVHSMLLAVWGPALGFHVWLMHRLRGLPYYRGPAE